MNVSAALSLCWQRTLSGTFWLWGELVELVSIEFLLTRFDLPNGGSVILLRSAASALLLYVSVLLLQNHLDPCSSCPESYYWDQVNRTMHWYGSVFAILYAALYARFASQWTYLAGVYNQIKAAESRMDPRDTKESRSQARVLAEWKAGFIEDADVLHLAAKPLFASVIKAWEADPDVRLAFDRGTPGGERRRIALMRRVNRVYAQENRRHADGA